MLKSPFAETLTWGTPDSEGATDFVMAEQVERWIDEGGLFYAGARAAGAADFEAKKMIEVGVDIQAVRDAHPDMPGDFGTLGYLAFQSLNGEFNG
jgi:hypothetical protein